METPSLLFYRRMHSVADPVISSLRPMHGVASPNLYACVVCKHTFSSFLLYQNVLENTLPSIGNHGKNATLWSIDYTIPLDWVPLGVTPQIAMLGALSELTH